MPRARRRIVRIGERLERRYSPGAKLDYPVDGLIKKGANDRCLVVYSMARSGHHAVIMWLCYLSPDAIFVNNRPKSIPERLWAARKGWTAKEGDIVKRRWPSDISSRPRDLLIANYEDFNIEGRSDTGIMKYMDPELPLECVVLRDPLNFVASRAKNDGGSVAEQLPRMVTWKQHAKEFVGEGVLGSRLLISYNHWFASKTYRNRLASSIRYVNMEKAVDQVFNWGRGSSWTGTEMSGRAMLMPVVSRWRDFIDRDDYVACFDRESLDLTERIFLT